MTRMMQRAFLGISLLMLGACAPWTVRPIDADAKNSTQASAAITPAAYVDSIWGTKLLPQIMSSAVDARTLSDALAKSWDDARTRYGHQENNGPVYFLVKGDGRVTAIDMHSRVGLALVDVAPYDRRPDISIQFGPLLRGTALRDATGMVRFTDFVNQLQFADVGNELNDRVLKTILAPLDLSHLTGKNLSFAGALSAEPKTEPPLRELVPVKLTVVESGR